MATAHRTATIPGRFNAGIPPHPRFEILFAEDHQVALFRSPGPVGITFIQATYVPNPSTAWVVINVDIQLSRVADLTRVSRRLIGTASPGVNWRLAATRQESPPTLKAPFWTNVPTQRLGHVLHSVPNLEGVLTYSARAAARRNLVVFPSKKLRPGSHLQFHNPITGAVVTSLSTEPKQRSRSRGQGCGRRSTQAKDLIARYSAQAIPTPPRSVADMTCAIENLNQVDDSKRHRRTFTLADTDDPGRRDDAPTGE